MSSVIERGVAQVLPMGWNSQPEATCVSLRVGLGQAELPSTGCPADGAEHGSSCPTKPSQTVSPRRPTRLAGTRLPPARQRSTMREGCRLGVTSMWCWATSRSARSMSGSSCSTSCRGNGWARSRPACGSAIRTPASAPTAAASSTSRPANTGRTAAPPSPTA